MNNLYDVTPKLEEFTNTELIRALVLYLHRLDEHVIASTIEDGSWLETIMVDTHSDAQTSIDFTGTSK